MQGQGVEGGPMIVGVMQRVDLETKLERLGTQHGCCFICGRLAAVACAGLLAGSATNEAHCSLQHPHPHFRLLCVRLGTSLLNE